MSLSVNKLLEEACSHFCFSGYQFVGYAGEKTVACQGGVTSYWGETPVEKETLFDLGSLTKVILTTSFFARAVDAGSVDLAVPLSNYLSETKGSRLGALTIETLLSHRGGFIDWFPMYRELGEASLLDWLLANESKLLVGPEGSPRYTDFGPLLLGALVERLAGELSEVLRSWVLDPIGVEGICFGPLSPEKAVATEYQLERGKLLWGEVFDENCFALGGITGHAGLFGKASAVAQWALEWLNAYHGESQWLSQKVARRFVTPVPGGTWALGWDTKSPKGSTAGEKFSKASFGHLGYPGCSVWVDPEGRRVAVLLSNRVHPSRLDERIRGIRPRVHDVFVDEMER